mgnify:CR=1 FL=1
MDIDHKAQLLESARALISALEADNQQDIDAQLATLTQERETNLYFEIGKLTRQLHAALNNFNIDSRIANITEVGIPDTRERLNYIIDATEQAAHKTLQVVDDTVNVIDIIQQTTQDLTQRWQNSLTSNLSAKDSLTLQQDISNYFISAKQHAEKIQTNLSEITLAQGYQDLTGQVIRQVTDLVEEVETNLVDLIKVASEHQPLKQNTTPSTEAVDPIKAEGPQMNAADKVNVMANQDDVDDLLSSLGF